MTDEAQTPPAEAPAAPAAETPPAGVVESSILDTAAKPAEEPKAGEPAGDKPAEPTPFDPETFKAPEGLELTPEDKTEVSDLAKKHGLSSEAMTDLLTTYAKRLEVASKAGEKLVEEQNAKWVEEVKKDPTIGGDKLPETLSTIAKVLDNPAFSDPKWQFLAHRPYAGRLGEARRTTTPRLMTIVEMLSQVNEILDDMLWVEGNLPTGHKTTVRTGLPSLLGAC
jgi:hypothetical protein